MRGLHILTIVLLAACLSSCSRTNYKLFGNKSLPASAELKSFAFATDGLSSSVKDFEPTERAIFKELTRRNYFYDNENPDVMVFIAEYPAGVKLLSGNLYEAGNGQQYLENTKITSKKNTLLIQMVETQKHQTFWRGFSFASARSLVPNARPFVANSILNQ